MGAGCQQGPWLMWALFFPPQEGECLEAQRRLVALLMAFVCSLPRDVSWWGEGSCLSTVLPSSTASSVGRGRDKLWPQAVTRSVSLPGGDPPAGTLAPGAAGAELLLQLPLHSHHGRQVLRGAAEQAPGG